MGDKILNGLAKMCNLKVCHCLSYHGDPWISQDVIEHGTAVVGHHGNIRVTATNGGPW